MAKLTILQFPDPRLRTQARPVTQVDESIVTLIDDMFETMYAAEGVGLSATQVNVHQRVIVIDTSEQKTQPYVFINPVIEPCGPLIEHREGCLSVPGFFEDVQRLQDIRVTAWDRTGQTFTLEAQGLLSICIQHECDHLEGKLFVDYLSPLKRSRIRKKLEKSRQLRASAPDDT